MRALSLTGAVLVALTMFAAVPLAARADTPTPAPSPQPTSDIVLVMEDSYGRGDKATLALRNDGDVPYVYNQYWQACFLEFKDASGRSFKIPPAVHCDNPDESVLDPGETVTLLSNWALDECTIPGFFCYAARPLSSGDYTISGSLDSVDRTKRAEFSKTISVTGPQFTSDLSVEFSVIVSDPPKGKPPLSISLRNTGDVTYTVPPAGCFLLSRRPDGTLFSIPEVLGCDPATQQTLAPGGRLDIVTGWDQDECVEYGPTSCLATKALPAGAYSFAGGIWSADGQSFADVSVAYTISEAPSPSPVKLPDGGGAAAPGPASSFALLLAGAALAMLGVVALMTAAPRYSS